VDIRGRRTRAVVVPMPFLQAPARLDMTLPGALPAGFKYTKDHEWLDIAGDRGKVGITDYAQASSATSSMSISRRSAPNSRRGSRSARLSPSRPSRSSTRPAAGEVVEVNAGLKDKPETINKDAYASWMIVLKLANPADAGALLDAAKYGDLIK